MEGNERTNERTMLDDNTYLEHRMHKVGARLRRGVHDLVRVRLGVCLQALQQRRTVFGIHDAELEQLLVGQVLRPEPAVAAAPALRQCINHQAQQPRLARHPRRTKIAFACTAFMNNGA